MIRSTMAALGCLVVICPVWAQDLDSALEQVRELAESHRYQEVIELLAPFADMADPEARYVVAAETGRAYYHLGDYHAADTEFRTAVRLRPRRVETALYLLATSYLTGDNRQAYDIFRELLKSGATDLYLAVTLPGERLFLADPVVWEILEEYASPVHIDVRDGVVLGVALGQDRADVEARLGAKPADEGTALTARAGPYLIWVFEFDGTDTLIRVTLHNEHLRRYTPYRLHVSSELDWRASPENATASLGAPSEISSDGDVVVMSWDRGTVRLVLEFAPPRTPVPPALDPERPALRLVRLEAIEEAGGSDEP